MATGKITRLVRESLEVVLGDQVVGTIFHTRGQFSFAYSKEWLQSPQRFWLDPELELYAGEHHASGGNFRIFLDSAPDRWGRLLMERREALQAEEQGRAARTLREWDFLIGVQDITRMGALRFRVDNSSDFLDNQMLAAPPVTSLPELQTISRALEEKSAKSNAQLTRWLAALVAPGSSLGGARPKANFLQLDGSLWIAKFPSRADRRDVAAWEMLLHGMAKDAGITVPESHLLWLGGKDTLGTHRCFCVQRFDRVDSKQQFKERRFFVSAMTLLRADDGQQSHSYQDLAAFIAQHGAAGKIKEDLEQLFRRAAFNIMVSNRDDHLRNHGFIREATGWRLSPAYDMNPNPEKYEHALAIALNDPRPNIETLLATAAHYRLSSVEAKRVVDEVAGVVGTWKARAAQFKISGSEIQLMTGAFLTITSQ
jgi:serine/threonine-protein kinase HipA